MTPSPVQTRIAQQLGIDLADAASTPTGTTAIPGPQPAGEFAAMTVWEIGRIAADLAGVQATPSVDTLLASATLAGFAVQRLGGEIIPRLNDANPFIGLYECTEGAWIQLQGGFPTLRERTARVLGIAPDAVASEIATGCRAWNAADLEAAIASERGCAAVVRTYDEWRVHEHGRIVDALDAVEIRDHDAATDGIDWQPNPRRPLAGLRVLDLTRVLAGPTAARTLAMLGAEVLHVRGPDVPFIEPYVVDTGHGKRSAFCDLSDPDQADELRRVAARAHLVIDGNRPGVLARYGVGSDDLLGVGSTRLAMSIDCFGPDGPWAGRAGMEQVAQAACGVAAPEVEGGHPSPVAAAAIDYGTGYVAALGVLRALRSIADDGKARTIHASLCQTATRLAAVGRRDSPITDGRHRFAKVASSLVTSETMWGQLTHLPPPLRVEGLDIGWNYPPVRLGTHRLGFD